MPGETNWQSLYPFGTRHLEVDGYRMHYVDEGQGHPLLFVHGNPTWSFHWRKLIQEFRTDQRAIAVDHLGMGLSDKPQKYNYCLRQHSANLRRFIEHLDLDQITLLAQDWGGAMGLLAATQMPDRFARLILFNTGAFPPPFVPRRIAACRIPLAGTLAMRGCNLFALAAQRMASAHPEQRTPAELAGLIAPYDCWHNRVGIDSFVRDIPFSNRHPTWQTLATLESQLSRLAHLPTMFIWGMQDWCFTPACLERMLRHFPTATVHRMPDAGHWVVEEAPTEIIQHSRQFFTTHPLSEEEAQVGPT